MNYEWDEAKRESNIAKHGLDFVDAWKVLENNSSVTFEDLKHNKSEPRQITIGYLNDVLCTVVVHTTRSKNVRIISFRRANKKERSLL